MTHVEYMVTGLRATLVIDAAVVRARRVKKCQQCGRRRVAFAMSFTELPIGNPDSPWKCAPCSGLR